MATFTWEFEEMPLVILPGIEAGLINGAAEIEYWRGGWDIKSIWLEGYRKLTMAERDDGQTPWTYVPPPAEIAAIIHTRLEQEWRDHVQSAVDDQIELDRASAAEVRADYRRERMGV